jgi:aminoglycoside phosphotransferase
MAIRTRVLSKAQVEDQHVRTILRMAAATVRSQIADIKDFDDEAAQRKLEDLYSYIKRWEGRNDVCLSITDK